MRNFYLPLLVLTAMMIAGCAGIENNDARWASTGEQFWGIQGRPGFGGFFDNYQDSGNYKAPRKYYITEHDQKNYDNMSNRIEQRIQKINSNPGSPSGSFGTAPARPVHSSSMPAIPSVPME